MDATHNPRSMAVLDGEGFSLIEVVERWMPHLKRRKDLFEVIDILAVGHGVTVGLQVTSRGNMSSRKSKIVERYEDMAVLSEAGWVIEVWGWDQPKGKGTAWRLKRERLWLEDGEAHWIVIPTPDGRPTA